MKAIKISDPFLKGNKAARRIQLRFFLSLMTLIALVFVVGMILEPDSTLGITGFSGTTLAALMAIGDVDLYEINEAFAVQVLGSARALGMDEDRLNVSGGAIALGHPCGMTGARIPATLINNLQTHDKQFGIETMCVGGGQGMAMIIERLS